VENVFAVTKDVLAATPGKIYDQLYEDVTQRPGKVATVTAVSAGVGYGTTALLAKAPKVGGVVIAGAATFQALRYGAHTLDFIGEATDAGSEFQRRVLAERASKSLANEGALMVESAPGLVAGGILATRHFGTPKAYTAIGEWADRNVVKPVAKMPATAREVATETWAFNGPGRMRLPSQMLSQEGKVNALELGEMLSARHPWTGVETGRSIDLLKMRISRPFKGTHDGVDPGFSDKPGRILFHTHGPESAIGTRPGFKDLIATQDVGIVSRGSQTAFYAGQGREFNHALAAGADDVFAPKLQTLVLDAQRQTAFTLESVWQPKLSSWQPAVPRFVDYQRAREAMKSLDITKPWQDIQKIPTLPSIRGHRVDFEALNWMRTGVGQ